MATNTKQRKNRIYKDIDLSFSLNTLSGDIGKKLDANAIKQSLMNLLMIEPYERKFHPELGSPLSELLFSHMTPGLEQSIKIVIGQLIENFEPRVNIKDIGVRANDEQQLYEVGIHYLVIGVDQPQGLSLNLTRLR